MDALSALKKDLIATIDRLPTMENGKWIQRALESILQLAETEIDRLDWKILSAAVGDMERARRGLLILRSNISLPMISRT
jgi:hypothetical protein